MHPSPPSSPGAAAFELPTDQNSPRNAKNGYPSAAFWLSAQNQGFVTQFVKPTLPTDAAPVAGHRASEKTLMYPDGTYKGDVNAENLRDGKGRMWWKNGAVY